MADAQAENTLSDSHKIAAGAAAAHVDAISKIHGALVKAAQMNPGGGDPNAGPPPGGGGGANGMPSPEDFVNQDPAAAADFADGILKALHGLIMSYAQPSGNGAPVAPPEVGGEGLGY